jgi:hypothetical protein
MKLQRFALALAGVGMVAATAASVPASAQPSPKPTWSSKAVQSNTAKAATAGTCLNTVALPSASPIVNGMDITAGNPPRAEMYDPPIDNFVATRANATWYWAANAALTQFYYYGLFLQGGNLYRHTTYLPENKPPVPTFKRIGSGWTSFKSIATSNYNVAQPRHSYLYGLNSNGSLYRYAMIGGGFKALGPLPGFRSFRAMTVISETATYDTLLMTTNTGGLYTVHIPVAAGAKPVLKLIRSTGWATYDSLAVQSCGTRGGSMIVAVDRDTKTGYQYAMSKANGTATAITAYGKIPAAFDGVDHVSMRTAYDQLVGE